MDAKRIVVIGGGTGTYTVLMGLKKYPVHLSAVVSMADDGGSTKILREEFGVLPPGSVRPALVALSNAEHTLSDLFNFRFTNGEGLNGHNFGNLFLTALTKLTGSFEKAIEEAGRILQIKGEVIPSTLESCKLYAELENGQVIEGEANIDVPKHDATLTIKKLWLAPACAPNPKALLAISKADLIVIGPGDLFTSILPNFLIPEISQAVKQSSAKKVYVCNLMTKIGETNGFTAQHFVDTLEEYIGKGALDTILLNTTKPSQERIVTYEKEGSQFVEFDAGTFESEGSAVIKQDLLRSHGFIRHDSDKLADTLISLL